MLEVRIEHAYRLGDYRIIVRPAEPKSRKQVLTDTERLDDAVHLSKAAQAWTNAQRDMLWSSTIRAALIAGTFLAPTCTAPAAARAVRVTSEVLAATRSPRSARRYSGYAACLASQDGPPGIGTRQFPASRSRKTPNNRADREGAVGQIAGLRRQVCQIAGISGSNSKSSSAPCFIRFSGF